MNPNREMTYGDKAVGLNFNPSGDATVQKLKELYAQIIDVLNDEPCTFTNAEENGAKTRLLKIAITEAQGAQMWAVKAVTYKF